MSSSKRKQYIWEYLLCNEEVHFEQAQVWEPYEEIAEEIHNDEGICCKYNAMYRYENIFLPYFMKQGIPESAKDKVIFDILSHYLAYVEVKCDLTYKESRKRRFGEDIRNGMYGERISEIYNEMTLEEQYAVMHYLDLQNSVMESTMNIYCNVMIRLLGTGIIYKDCYNEKHFILYMGEIRNSRQEKMIYVVNTLFLPLGFHVEVLWDKHFAVLGRYQTLQIDEIRIM